MTKNENDNQVTGTTIIRTAITRTSPVPITVTTITLISVNMAITISIMFTFIVMNESSTDDTDNQKLRMFWCLLLISQ